VISTLPFSDTIDFSSATTEPGELPGYCWYNFPGTVWYAFTASTTTYLTASSVPLGGMGGPISIYTGSDLSNLVSQACSNYYGPLTFHVVAGTTYYIQLGANASASTFTLDVAHPIVSISTNPFQPSIFDTVQFYNNS